MSLCMIVLSKDLPNLLTHVIYDEKLSIFLPRIGVKYEYVNDNRSRFFLIILF
jgi:hypothetical protein